MLIERLLNNLSVTIEPFAVCEIETGCRLDLDDQESVVVHFVLAGAGSIRVGAASVEVAPSHLVLVPARCHHQVVALAGTRRSAAVTRDTPGLVHLQALGSRGVADVVLACGRLQARFGDGPALFGLLTEPIILDFSDSAGMQAVFDDMLAESAASEPGAAVMLSVLMNRCLVIMFRRICDIEECPLPWLRALEDERMAGALESMLDQPEADHSLESLATSAAMSRTAFAAAFKNGFGEPPMTLLRQIRLRKAAELLRCGRLNVGDVASRVGFASRAHFSTAFMHHFGVSPGSYRQLEGG